MPPKKEKKLSIRSAIVALATNLRKKIPLEEYTVVALFDKPVAPKPSSPKPSSPKPVAPKPSSPKPSSPEPIAPKPSSPKPVANTDEEFKNILHTGEERKFVSPFRILTEEEIEEKNKQYKEKREAAKKTLLARYNSPNKSVNDILKIYRDTGYTEDDLIKKNILSKHESGEITVNSTNLINEYINQTILARYQLDNGLQKHLNDEIEQINRSVRKRLANDEAETDETKKLTESDKTTIQEEVKNKQQELMVKLENKDLSLLKEANEQSRKSIDFKAYDMDLRKKLAEGHDKYDKGTIYGDLNTTGIIEGQGVIFSKTFLKEMGDLPEDSLKLMIATSK